DIPSMRAYRKWHTTGEILPLHWSVDGKLVLQILFDRGISDRHVDQCSLKARDELVVFDRIDSDAAVAPPQYAVILGAKTSGRVPVRMDDPFIRRRVVDVTIVRGHALEDGNDHVSINGSVVAVHDRPVMFQHLGMRGLE